jgi:hypothetical protein
MGAVNMGGRIDPKVICSAPAPRWAKSRREIFTAKVVQRLYPGAGPNDLPGSRADWDFRFRNLSTGESICVQGDRFLHDWAVYRVHPAGAHGRARFEKLRSGRGLVAFVSEFGCTSYPGLSALEAIGRATLDVIGGR